jgi:hypothetical protein
MPVKTRELYSSPNGDRWLLCREADTQRVFIKHEPNAPSGGHVSEIDTGTFLSRGSLNPEHQALLRLIEDYVSEENPVRVTEVFIEELDLDAVEDLPLWLSQPHSIEPAARTGSATQYRADVVGRWTRDCRTGPNRLVLVAYHSATGKTKKMTQGVAEGVKSVPGSNVIIKRVGEVTADDLLSSDGVIIGSPVYFGNMSGEVRPSWTVGPKWVCSAAA